MPLSVSHVLLVWLAVLVLLGPSVAKKTKPSAKPFAAPIVRLVQCDICRYMVVEAAAEVDAMRRNESRRTAVKEEDIFEEALEAVCNPFRKPGEWLRSLDVAPVKEGDGSEQSNTVAVEPLDIIGKCDRDCQTVVDACDAALSSDEADSLSGMLYAKKPVEKIQTAVCSRACSKKEFAAARRRATPAMVAETGRYVPEEIDSKELEIEAMIDRMQRTRDPGTPGMDVFSRDEMHDMKRAMEAGDLDTLRELDPHAEDLSEEEFAALQAMQQEGSGLEGVASDGGDVIAGVGDDRGEEQNPAPSLWDRISSWLF